MLTTIRHNLKKYKVNLLKPIDISIPISVNESVNAWCLENPKIEPVTDGNWVGSVKKGNAVNFNTIEFNPHAHGTHTECVGHITKEFISINDCLKTFFFIAELISITPEKQNDGDEIITLKSIKKALKIKGVEALIIRTFPNKEEKKTTQYSNTNPPYLSEEVALYLREIGIKHLLIDLPSIDKEKDAGKLLAHKAFWNFGKKQRLDATITEFVYVENKIKDGSYLLNLQIASFQNDASPSKPILFAVK